MEITQKQLKKLTKGVFKEYLSENSKRSIINDKSLNEATDGKSVTLKNGESIIVDKSVIKTLAKLDKKEHKKVTKDKKSFISWASGL